MEIKGYRSRVGFDGQTVTITKPIRGETRIPVGQVTAIEIGRAGLGLVAIKFVVPGAAPVARSNALGSTKDALNDPYSAVVRSGRRSELEELRQKVEAART